MSRFAQIIVDISHENIDRIFEYRIPLHMEGIIREGMEVRVPFGRGNTERKGYVVGLVETPVYDVEKIKEISGEVRAGRGIETKLIILAAWMKEAYGGTMIQSLKMVLPIKTKEKLKSRRTISLCLKDDEATKTLAVFEKKHQKARARLLSGLMEQPRQEYEIVTKKLNITSQVIRSLETQGIIKVESSDYFRNPIKYKKSKWDEKQLTEEQNRAIDIFWEDYSRDIRKTYLVFGVTGSGKTEVYINMIKKVVAGGRQAIMLIPEISLTYQTMLRFYSQFGDRVSIIHSKMTRGMKSDQIERVKRGDVDVMIGPRSALFTPFAHLGLIVIDEEHETTYKSEQVPRYHARETAIKRAEIEGASVVLGSATPSMEAFYRCERGEMTLLELKERPGSHCLPRVHIVDMRQEMRGGNSSIFSGLLTELMKGRLDRKEQIMLFLNRRGYAGFVSCRECGYVVQCPHCDVSMTIHQGGRMMCHYCGYQCGTVGVCPSCQSKHIGGFRAGTQQIADEAVRRFPGAKVLRMDRDSTKGSDDYAKILSAFFEGEADILVGTQMIVKGHDIGGVTLVGILAADMSLYANDYRAGERTFQILTQAAGRAGRGEAPGEVVIQTYNPEHYSIKMAKTQDYRGFYGEEIRYRNLMGYPPAEELMAILVSGKDEERLEMAVSYLKKYILLTDKEKSVRIIGPASPAVGKIADVFRRVIYLKCRERKRLESLKGSVEKYIEINRGFDTLKIQFDFNPMSI